MQGHFPYRFQPPSTQFYTNIVQRMSPRKMGQSKASSSLGEGTGSVFAWEAYLSSFCLVFQLEDEYENVI